MNPVSILHKSTAGRYRPVSYPDGPITARCRFMKNANWEHFKYNLRLSLCIFVSGIIRSTLFILYSQHSIHYENMPIQIYRRFQLQKLKNFQTKPPIFFHASAQNIDCGYSLEPPRRGGSNEYPQSMLFSKIRKIMYNPCKPQFYYIKVKGVKFI